MKVDTDLRDSEDNTIYSDSIILTGGENKSMGNVEFARGSFRFEGRLLEKVSDDSIVIGVNANQFDNIWVFDKFSESSDIGNDYDEDVDRIVEAFESMSRSVSRDFCKNIWIDYSSSLMSGWLYLPKSQTELIKILLNFISNKARK